ncbi:MAG TPA: tetratricopeptide repeat protein [Burkholderiaceae bacterium]|nr:tetratricopeptide repeat protein [Burkholderiaceae bacterium]
MSTFRLAHLGLLAALLGANIAPTLIGASTAYAAESTTLRPEIGKPLQGAIDDIKKGKFKDALSKVHEAEAVGGRSPYENYMVEYIRASAAQGAGDNELAARSFEAVISTGYLTGAAQTKMVLALGELHYRASEYPKAIVWLTRYLSEGGDDPAVRGLLINAYYGNNEFARAGKEVAAQIQAEEKAGRTPSDQELQMLASCAIKLGDKPGYLAAVEKMVTYHPKKELWVDLLNKLESSKTFNDSRLGLDAYRFRFAIGAVTTTADYMNMAELALQAGYPTEAKKVIDAGFKTGAFGAGPEAARQKRLQDLAVKKEADDQKALAQTEAEVSKSKDGTGLVNLGYDYVTMGQFDKGIALMEQGMEKGDVKHADDAKLHLGIAYLQADKKSKALQTFKTVQGTDGTVELAHFWTILTNHPVN